MVGEPAALDSNAEKMTLLKMPTKKMTNAHRNVYFDPVKSNLAFVS